MKRCSSDCDTEGTDVPGHTPGDEDDRTKQTTNQITTTHAVSESPHTRLGKKRKTIREGGYLIRYFSANKRQKKTRDILLGAFSGQTTRITKPLDTILLWVRLGRRQGKKGNQGATGKGKAQHAQHNKYYASIAGWEHISKGRKEGNLVFMAGHGVPSICATSPPITIHLNYIIHIQTA